MKRFYDKNQNNVWTFSKILLSAARHSTRISPYIKSDKPKDIFVPIWYWSINQHNQECVNMGWGMLQLTKIARWLTFISLLWSETQFSFLFLACLCCHQSAWTNIFGGRRLAMHVWYLIIGWKIRILQNNSDLAGKINNMECRRSINDNKTNALLAMFILMRFPSFVTAASQLISLWQNQGAVSIRKTLLPGTAIPMLKIRRPNGRLIFNMEIAIRR